MTNNNSTDLVKTLSRSLALNSLDDLVRSKKAENVVLLLDCSGSMSNQMRNGKRRIDGLRDVVADVQKDRPTRMIGFGISSSRGDDIAFIGRVPEPNGGTPLARAIDFAREAGFGRAVVISDGMPDDQEAALEAAGRFGGQIDVVYVGDPEPEDRVWGGAKFLLKLAESTGGTSFDGDLSAVKQLASTVKGLLAGNVEEDIDAIEMGAVDDDDDKEN